MFKNWTYQKISKGKSPGVIINSKIKIIFRKIQLILVVEKWLKMSDIGSFKVSS